MRLPEIHRRGAAVLLVAFALLGGLAGVLVGAATGPQWKATSTVLVQWTPSDVLSLLLNGSATQVGADDLSDVAGSISSPAVLSAVATRLGDGTSSDLLSRALSADPVAASHLITITATATSGQRAESIADAAAKTLAATQKAAVTAATGNLPAPGTSTDAAQLQLRAQLVASRVDPLQLLGTTAAVQTSPSRTTPVALAVVGLAAAGLLVIGLSLRAARRQGRAVRLVPLVRLPHGASDTDTMAAATGALPGWPHTTLTVEPLDEDARVLASDLEEHLRGLQEEMSHKGTHEGGLDDTAYVLVVASVDGVVPDGVVALAERRHADLVVLTS